LCIFRVIIFHRCSVNETLVGVTSNDALFALSGDETSANCGNRMFRLAAHLIEQQSFAPMFPASTHQQVFSEYNECFIDDCTCVFF
jgi:hypothetical protein